MLDRFFSSVALFTLGAPRSHTQTELNTHNEATDNVMAKNLQYQLLFFTASISQCNWDELPNPIHQRITDEL